MWAIHVLRFGYKKGGRAEKRQKKMRQLLQEKEQKGKKSLEYFTKGAEIKVT